MVGYILRRMLVSLVVIFVAVSLTFLMARISPSDPALIRLGGHATPEELAAERARLGLDAPLIRQYIDFLWGAVRLDFGPSLIGGGSAMNQVLARVPNTLLLGSFAMLLVIAIGLPLGLIAGYFSNRPADRTLTTGSLIGQSIPEFWLGLMLMLIFARKLHWLPSSGTGSFQHLILPGITLALPLSSVFLRLVRAGLIGVMKEDYVEAARAKGLSERQVLLSHALPNTLIPVVTVAGLQLGYLIGGTAVIETVFAWPGLGNLFVRAIGMRDFPMIQACIAVVTVVVVLTNLLVDILYVYLNPRIRVGAEA